MPDFRAERAMMFALHGRPSEVDVFAFHLAEKLGKTVEEIDRMSAVEYLRWQAYYTAKNAIEGVRSGGR